MARRSFIAALLPTLARQPTARLVPQKSASVAVILFERRGVEEVLLIMRAERPGDPWSGQVALPGGRTGAEDKSFEETARRETSEEVGIDLGSQGAFAGYMAEQRPRLRDIVVVPSVFKLDAAVAVETNAEVASFAWVPLRELAKPEARSTYRVEREGRDVSFPSLVYRNLAVWGMTERILSAVLGAP